MRAAASLALALTLAAASVRADENSDLNFIPEAAGTNSAAPATPAPAPASVHGRLYLENAVSLDSLRSALPVPFPAPAPASWEEELFLDAREEWTIAPHLNLDYSGRLNLRQTDRLPIPSHENVRNDFREGFLTWEPASSTFIDAGRINVKNGVAAGYNPTDYFKTHAVVEPLSLDPSVLREDRLGTAMVRVNHVGEWGSATVAFAPEFEKESPVFNATNLPSFDPTFGRTNAHDRLLVEGSANLWDLNPQLLFYREGESTSVGANLSEPMGHKTILYLEGSGGGETSLIDDALRYGRATGTIPGSAPAALPFSGSASFRAKVAAGASYATENNITFNAEYHYDGSGFSHQDWRNWFAIGSARSGIPGVAPELWYIRDYANDVGEPVARHSIFLRFDWVDAFVPNLEITGFTNTDLFDGSTLAQLAADYYLSNQWTVGVIAAANLGSRRTEFGSLPQAESILFKVARYF
jgi:hypothetical protein